MTCEEMIYSNDYLDFIIEFEQQLSYANYCYQRINDSLGIGYVLRQEEIPYEISKFGYSYVPKVYTTTQNEFNEINYEEAGITNVWREPYNLSGTGVVVGFVDTGIDYMNPVFRNADGTTRIRAIWDQTERSGSPPENFLYGSLYTREDINRAINSDNPYDIVPVRDEDRHGSRIASVVAGSPLENGFRGVAYNAEIVVVKLKPAKQYLKEYYQVAEDVACYSETDVLTALAFLDSFAIPLVRPLVTCFALGTNLGAHCGKSVLSNYINLLTEKKSRVIVVGTGNEGDKQHHKEGLISFDKKEDIVEINVADSQGFVAEFWGKSPYVYTFNIRTPQGEEIPFISPRDKGVNEYRFVKSDSVVYVDNLLVEGDTGAQVVFLRIINPSNGIWQMKVRNSTERLGGGYNMYLPMEQMLKGNVVFLEPEVLSTIVEPGYASNAMCVTPYNAINNSILTYSGRGFGNCGGIKPEVAAPGVDVYTAYGIGEGSSYATAIAAGGVALLMQWAVIEENNMLIDARIVNNYFTRSAIRMQTMEYPNTVWGYGIYNVNSIFDFLATIL